MNQQTKNAASSTPDTDKAIDPMVFRNALGQFPTGVCVVTTNSADGEDLGMTMSSFNSLSLDPPLVLFSIDRRAHSLDAWQKSEGYAINVLAESQKEISGRFARPLTNKWAGIEFDRGFADAPLFRGVAANFQCAPFSIHEGGDHVLFIAQVRHYQSYPDRNPLIFCKGKYGSLKSTNEAAPLWPLSIHY